MRVASSLLRVALVINPTKLAGKRIRFVVLSAFVAAVTGLAIAPASSGSFRVLLFREPWASGGRLPSAKPARALNSLAVVTPDAPVSDTQLTTARRGHTATLLADGKVLIAGGENADGFVTSAEIFDPATGTFSVSSSLNSIHADHNATRLPDGRVLIAGGRNSIGPTNSTEIFDPTAGAFSNGPPLNSARSGQSATPLSDGRIVIAGGDLTGSVEIYDPQTNAFSTIGAKMLTPRAFHSAVAFTQVIGDQHIEKVLIVSGLAPDGAILKSGELFDVASSSFSTVSNELEDARQRPLLRVLPDAKVQILGGCDHESIEIYDPAANIFGAHAHVYPIGDDHPNLMQEILESPTRAALFHLGAAAALLNREAQTITELPVSNQALVVGGIDSSGNNLNSASVLDSSPASVTTNKLDYPPGTPVIVTGAGWQPYEMVTLMFHEDPHVNTENAHTFTVQADADGKFICQQYAPERQDAGVTYILAAKSESSGWTAQTSFTDTTDPTAQSIPYSQDFSALASNSTTYPAGWQGWQLSTSGSSTSFRTTAPTADLALTASSSASTNTSGVHNYNGKIGILASGTSDPALALAINTTGHSNVTVSFDIMTIRNPYDGSTNTRINHADLQYRVGTSGSFSSVSGNSNGIYQNNTTTQTGSGVTAPQNSQNVSLTLPAACDDQSVVQLRWVQRDTATTGGSRPSFAVDNLVVCPGVAAAVPVTGSAVVCSGATGVTYSISSVTGATTYDWSVPTGTTIISGQGTTSITVNFGSSSGNVTVVPKNTCNSGASASLAVAVNSAPNITVQPVSVTDACAGGPVSFSVTATGASLAYQWRKGGVALSNGGNISGADSATLTINPVVAGDAVSYEVVVSGECAPSQTSTPATLTLAANSPPTITSFTAGTSALPSAFAIDYIDASTGDTLVLGASASDPDSGCGDSVGSYQWTINGVTTGTATNSLSINWATLQSTYGISASGTTGNTYPLSVKAFDTFNEPSSTVSGTLTVYRNVIAPSLVVDAATCNQPTSFAGSASKNLDPRRSIVSYAFDFGDGTTYTETAASHTDGTFDGHTTHTYAHAGSYDVVLTVIDDTGQSAQTAVPVNVTIDNVAPTITSTGGPYIINLGDNLVLNGTATDANTACGDVLTFKWDINNDVTFDYSGATGLTTFTAADLNALGVGPGNHTIAFRVTDSFNASATQTMTLTVVAPSLTIPENYFDNEGDSAQHNFVLSASLSSASTQTITVDYTLSDGSGGNSATGGSTCTSGADYINTGGRLTIAAGQTSGFINIPVCGDTIVEPNETFILTLSNPQNVTVTPPGSTVGTIQNDDTEVALGVSPSSVNEDGAANLVYTFTRSGVTANSLTVNFSVSGTANFGTDYSESGAATFTASSGTVTFGAGNSTATVTIDPTPDTIDEQNQTVILTATSGAGYNLGSTNSATGTIADDDAAPSISINDVAANEGDSGTTGFNFTVLLSNQSSTSITVDYYTQDSTAASPSDYTAVTTTTLTFAPGENSKQVAVSAKGDTTYEVDESFFVNLTNNSSNSAISDGQGIGQIQNDDTKPSFAINDLSMAEGNSGATNFIFTVTKTGATELPATVNYATANGTTNPTTGGLPCGGAGVDYEMSSGTLSFAAAQTTMTVTVRVCGDTTSEANETFFVNLSSATNTTISDNQGLGTITDDDGTTYIFQGFFAPIDNPPIVNTTKAGSAVPVKWRITTSGGTVPDPASFAGLFSYAVNCGSTDGLEAPVETTAPGDSSLQYLGDGNWQINWKTLPNYPKGSCRVLELRLNDGTSHYANFKFK